MQRGFRCTAGSCFFSDEKTTPVAGLSHHGYPRRSSSSSCSSTPRLAHCTYSCTPPRPKGRLGMHVPRVSFSCKCCTCSNSRSPADCDQDEVNENGLAHAAHGARQCLPDEFSQRMHTPKQLCDGVQYRDLHSQSSLLAGNFPGPPQLSSTLYPRSSTQIYCQAAKCRC